jgi:hypothetical protein
MFKFSLLKLKIYKKCRYIKEFNKNGFSIMEIRKVRHTK